jgi:hypothetical protein
MMCPQLDGARHPSSHHTRHTSANNQKNIGKSKKIKQTKERSTTYPKNLRENQKNPKNPKLPRTCSPGRQEAGRPHVVCSFGFFGFFEFSRRFFGYVVDLSLVCLIFLDLPMFFGLFADVCLVW